MKKLGILLAAAVMLSFALLPAACSENPQASEEDPTTVPSENVPSEDENPSEDASGNEDPAESEEPEESGSATTVTWDFPYIDPADDEEIVERAFDDSITYSYDSISLRVVQGSFTVTDGVYVSNVSTSMMVNDGLETTDGTPFPYGTISCTLRSIDTTDSGIVFGLTGNGTSYWENGVSYYFYFLGQGGYAYLGKVTQSGGSVVWSALKVVQVSAVDSTKDYTLKVVVKSNKIVCYLDDELMFGYKDPDFLEGTGWGIRTGAQGVTFSDLSLTNEYLYE